MSVAAAQPVARAGKHRRQAGSGGVEAGVYTVQEAAARLGVSDWTVYEPIKRCEHPFDGTVRVIRMGRARRVHRADLDRLLGPQVP